MEEADFLQNFLDFETESSKRKECERCGRPATVCLCFFLPSERIKLRRTKLHILQHPNEENRPLHTVAILEAALTKDSCIIYKGRRFGKQICPGIHQIIESKHTYLIYPGQNTKMINEVISAEVGEMCNLIMLDGTWRQAASIYSQNEFLQSLCKIQLTPDRVSEYVIRTQPTDNSLSTVECAALALEVTEDRKDIGEILLKPLRGLCQFQLDHGATVHHSKESILNSC